MMQPERTPRLASGYDATVGLTQKLVQVPSVTAIDPKDRPASRACLAVLAEAAQKAGATVTHFAFEGGHAKWGYPVDNIFIDWTFGKAEKHLCYMGHLDVVPPGETDAWRDDPFSGVVRDGFLYGRGTTDMKGSVAAFLTAVSESLPALARTDLRISMIVTMDEEWAAVNGSRKVLETLKVQGIAPDAFIVGEPSSQDSLGTHIKIGRRGSLCGTFSVKGVQGHAAYPGLFQNPNRALALALAILNSHRFNDGNEYFPATNFEPIAMTSGDFNASAVIPGEASMLWNIRYTPDHTPDSLEAWITDTLANPPDWARNHPDAALLRHIAVTANKDTASLPYRSTPAVLARAAQDAVETTLGIASTLDGSGGTTDGRFAAAVYPDAEIIELGVPERGGKPGGIAPPDYMARGGMHQIDERVALDDLVNLRHIFTQTVINYDAYSKKQHDRGNPARPDHPSRLV